MSAPHESPYDHKFERLMELAAEGHGDALFGELLRHGQALFDPLSEFLIRQPNHPRLAVLIDLIGKCLDDRAIAILMRFLDINIPELRCAAANGLGWMRARVGLEKLDLLEGNDPDPRVRHESRAAIEEILKDFPRLHTQLVHHRPYETSAYVSGEHDFVPNDGPDSAQQIKLMAALPRLLALDCPAVPLHYSPGDRLHLAVPAGAERRLEARLAQITGHNVHLHSWTLERIKKSIDVFYKMGDDDFCAFHDQLTPIARDEVVERILLSVDPGEPACPLEEANDAVEAVQMFLASAGSLRLRRVEISYTPPEMNIAASGIDGHPVPIVPPDAAHRERFMAALRIVANLDPGAGLSHQSGGLIKCLHCSPSFRANVSSEKTIEGERIVAEFEVVG